MFYMRRIFHGFFIMIVGCWRLSNLVIKPRKLSCDTALKLEEKRGRYNKEFYKTVNSSNFHIRSNFGYDISCVMLEPKKENLEKDKVAILCHGFTHAKYGCLIYGEIYLKMGYRVIIYDHCNHGSSGGCYTSMGHYEKHDLKKVVDWCYNNFGPDCRIVTHGESMGGATVLLHLAIDNRVKCVVADCAYSDLSLLLEHQLKVYYHLPKFIIKIESLITYLRAGFWYSDVSPIKVVSKTKTPILFIHGKKDRYVPTYMTKDMYKSKKGKKAIYLVARAKHAQSFVKNRIGYEEKVKKFVNKYI